MENQRLLQPDFCSSIYLQVVSLVIMIMSSLMAASANFYEDFDKSWGDDRIQILNNGEVITLTLDENSGSGFQSRNQYLFSKIDMQIKVVPHHSAGMVTAYYLSSIGEFHDEIDFEFLGRVEGDPHILQTNIFINGIGKRENHFFLWFDPTVDFHNYTILWSPHHIVLYIDGTPIREFKNKKEKGAPFPLNQAMRLYGSLWNAESWATRGGAAKIDWTKAPFKASYKDFMEDGCFWSSNNGNGTSICSQTSNSWISSTSLDDEDQTKMKLAQDKFMFYNYCNDLHRFPQGLPPECN